MEKGHSQVKRVDFGDISSPIAKLTSIILVLSLAIVFDMEIEKMDASTTFFHAYLEEEIYMKYLEGFIAKGKDELVYKLKIFLKQ